MEGRSGKQHAVALRVIHRYRNGMQTHDSTLSLAVGIVNLWIAIRKRRTLQRIVLDTLRYSIPAILLVLPWYIRSFYVAGNPVWPVANGLFNGLDYAGGYSVDILLGTNESNFSGYASQMISRLVEGRNVFFTSLWNWSWDGNVGWQRAIGIYYVAFLPGIMVFWGDKKLRLIAGVAGLYYLIAVTVVDGNPRYNIALIVSVRLVGYVADQWGHLGSKYAAALFRAIFVISIIGSVGHAFYLAYPAIQYAKSSVNKEQFLLENESNYEAFRFVNESLPADKNSYKALLRDFIVNAIIFGIILTSESSIIKVISNPDLLIQRMEELGISHIVRMIRIPQGRLYAYPQYFLDEFHESFRMKYLKLLHER